MDKKTAQADFLQQYNKYLVYYVLVLLVVLCAFSLVHYRLLEGIWLVAAVVGLALVQLGLQLYGFLHIGTGERKPRYTLWSGVYVFLMMLVVVMGSLWIMINMNYRMHMSPEQMNEFMLKQNKKGF